MTDVAHPQKQLAMARDSSSVNCGVMEELFDSSVEIALTLRGSSLPLGH